ncbi:MAG: diguanylate cyclase [Butyrivibrio sp.]|nr:diguanylate cyclase [Butyrivibrio sp.]
MGKKHKILIVDDEKISLRMTDHILSSEYDTVCAASGKEAIKLYKSERPDLVLSDLRMPEIDGFELQKKLHEEMGFAVPFMFMTSDKKDETESKGFAMGALDYIKKPFRADVLLRRVSNILKNVEQIRGLKQAAVTDPMTGLLNKASSQEEIDILVRSDTGALMMIDLDSFKPVNDIYGHDMGDKILIRFSEIIRSAIRSTDLAGRLGGDEFVVFCKNISDEEVIAEKSRYINEQLLLSAKSLMGQDMTIPIGASIGCAFAPDDGHDFLTLFKKADKALYDVKINGKHGYKVFSELKRGEDEASAEATALPTAMMLMSERSPGKGALVLTSEQYKLIYRFLSRMVTNYQCHIHVLLFSVKVHGDVDPEKAIEDFVEIMKNSLRQSDVITRYGKNQVLLILLKATPIDIDVVTERIMMNWDSNIASDHCHVTYEVDTIK